MSVFANLKESKQIRKISLSLMIVLLTLVAACGGGGILPGGGSPYSSAKVGDTIQFGGLDWIVLTVENGKALILSEKILEERAYHSKDQDDIAWEKCSLREFLNGSFYNSTFSEQEKKWIIETRLTNRSGNNTDDRVFLLSVDEVNEYMGDNAHINMRNAKIAGGTSWWWLRSPGNSSNSAAGVSYRGTVSVYDVDGKVPVGGPLANAFIFSGGGVRPALWLNL